MTWKTTKISIHAESLQFTCKTRKTSQIFDLENDAAKLNLRDRQTFIISFLAQRYRKCLHVSIDLINKYDMEKCRFT